MEEGINKIMTTLKNKKGIDISYANGDIDLSKVKKFGYEFVMIRCGYGSDITSQDDTQFAYNVTKAEKLGMPWGVYLFSYACSTIDAKSELAHIDRLLKAQAKKGFHPTMPIALDIEPSNYIINKGGWTKTNLTNVATIVLDGLAKLGYYPMIYTGYSELDGMLSDHIRNDYDCWFAQWNSTPNAYKYNRLGIWQYGGETNYIDDNSISGVGIIDKNKCYKDYPTIIKNGGYNGFKKSSIVKTTISNNIPDVTYRVKANGKWWGEIENLSDYAGVVGYPITDVAIKVSKGSVKYRVHVKGGNWLGWITCYNINNSATGYAGNGKPIDAIEIYYSTPSDVKNSLSYCLKAKYRVSPVNNRYYDWQYDDEKINNQDGYAGSFGRLIDRLQIILSK